MKFLSKIKWIASILLVFFIVLITNLIDQENFNRLSYSVTTIYEDRLVASDLLFDISQIIHQKELALVVSDSVTFRKIIKESGEELDRLIFRYKATKLTQREEVVFSRLMEGISSLKSVESTVKLNRTKLASTINRVQDNLRELSKIQLEEGRRQVLISAKLKDTINLFTQGEIIFLIVMAVLIQIIILYEPSASSEDENG